MQLNGFLKGACDNWRTTALGIAALGPFVTDLFTFIATHEWSGNKTEDFLSLMIGLCGIVAKDFSDWHPHHRDHHDEQTP